MEESEIRIGCLPSIRSTDSYSNALQILILALLTLHYFHAILTAFA
jgi:hypothetical protein